MRSALNCKLLEDPVVPQGDKTLGLQFNSAPHSLTTILVVRKHTRL